MRNVTSPTLWSRCRYFPQTRRRRRCELQAYRVLGEMTGPIADAAREGVFERAAGWAAAP